ncbi:cysteine-rich motor neuron 1 protein [Leptopilina heterotoma]|uniref:cysteine-rich motor neuron 1 protein n=1 Tax=Leptopilina heterotoma TaxID=63436 RepID=UPI001CA7C437|nr:cysteine-rich motor neuron 1 protein [Leptopilina heterotoma]XP_043463313.1 cysteine-rich motor neuron 1 protein [Leptopilina heterotoma]XP_043463314.1 cysteine-rich motor neuron 1 protein [Leptopilina heterotoma]
MTTSRAAAFLVLSCFIGVHGSPCPEDSVAAEDGRCKCVAPCPTDKCRPGQQPVPVRAADPETPGSCCPLYKCLPSESVSWLGEEDEQELLSCTSDSGLLRSDGESWQQGECVNCICERGKVSCQATMCKSCEKPTSPAPGECCPRCPPLHNATAKCKTLADCKLQCSNGYISDNNNCPLCQCVDAKTPADSANREGKICPQLPHCGLNCELVEDEDGCRVCGCTTDIPTTSAEDRERKESEEDKIVCSELKCDLHCENGLLMDENDCTLCQCKPSHPGCPAMSDCKKKCSFGYKVNKRGCSICRCRASCIDQHNKTHPEGSRWELNSCTTCSCDASGRLSCKEKPPEPGNCCPICPITMENETENAYSGAKNWGTVPITLIIVLALLCVILIIHIVRNKFRVRLSPTVTSYTPYPSQYYKCVPIYDTPVHQNEKMVRL